MARSLLVVIGVFTLTATCVQSENLHPPRDDKPAQSVEQCAGNNLANVLFQSRHVCPAIDLQAHSEDPSWGPWTYRPYCNHRNYCVFTNSLFRKYHGISIISTPESIANTPNLLDLLFTIPKSREPDPPPYEILSVPGRGIGVRATRPIRRYEIIMTDSASVLVDSEMPRRMKHAEGVELMTVAMNQLPEPDSMLTLARSKDNLTTAIADDIMMTNSFGLPLNDINRMALFHKISVSFAAITKILANETDVARRELIMSAIQSK